MSSVLVFGGTKGGVGKTSLARATAVESVRKGVDVHCIDLNPKQRTLARWSEIRAANRRGLDFAVTVARNAAHAITLSQNSTADLIVIDAPGEVDAGTLKVAQHADLFVQVAGRSLDDLEPMINLFHELIQQGITIDKLVAVAYKLDRDLAAARSDHAQIKDYVQQAGFAILDSFVRELRSARTNHNLGLAITEASHVGPRIEAQTVVNDLISLLVSKTQ